MRRRLAECQTEWQARFVADVYERIAARPSLERLGEDEQIVQVRKTPRCWAVESVDRADLTQSEADVSFP